MTRAIEYLRLAEQEWRRLRSDVDRFGPDRVEKPTASGWTVKEMLSHVAFWEESTAPVVLFLLRDVPFPWPYPDGWTFGSGYQPEGDWPPADVHNAREAAWATGQTAQALIDRLDVAHAWATWAIARITDEELGTDRFAGYLQGQHLHYVEHRLELASLLA